MTNGTEMGEYMSSVVLSPTAQFVFGVAYGVVLLGSSLGNAAVIGVVLIRRDMRSVTNMFIASSAMADLLVTLTTLWITPLYYWRRNWPYAVVGGEVMCYMSSVLGSGCMFWSPYVLAAIAVDRFFIINYPGLRRITRKEALAVIGLIWVASAAALSPLWYHMQHHQFVTESGRVVGFCLEVWVGYERLVYGVAVFVLRSLLPALVIAFSHVAIARRLRLQEDRLKEHRVTLRAKEEHERHNRLERLLTLMVFIFVASSFPWDAYNIYQDLVTLNSEDDGASETKDVLFLGSFLIAMLGTLWNPLVYAWWNENFKRELNHAVDCSQRKISVASPQI